jgi:hypothetical protein
MVCVGGQLPLIQKLALGPDGEDENVFASTR